MTNYIINDITNSKQWDKLYQLLDVSTKSPFFSSEYYKSYAEVEEGEPLCFAMYKDDDNFLFYPFIKKSINEIGYQLDDKTDIYLAVCLSDNDSLIGYTSINNIDWRNRNALWGSIFIEKGSLNKGLSIDIGKELLRIIFEEMPIYRFYSQLLASNIPSMKMVKRLGFTVEGVQRGAIYKLNQFHDLVCISMLKPEYDELYKNN